MKKILVSACLIGEPCRYDGLSKPDNRVFSLATRYELIPICPERDGGLPIPRTPAERIGDRVINKDGIDVTECYQRGASYALSLAKKNGCKMAILKAKSPSCGKGLIYDGTFTRTIKTGNGVCAELLINNNIFVLTEDELGEIDEDNSK